MSKANGNLAFDFTGKTVIVTGSARGIGLAIARHFITSGADVVMVDYDKDELAEAADKVGGIAEQADVANTEDVERVVARTVERTGRVDILINNAGILRDSMVWKIDDDAWDDVLAVHLGGSFRFVRACVPHFRRQEFGRVVNFTSYTGLHGNLGQANYSAAKAGLIGFTKTAAKDLARFGVTVNAVSPNAATRMVASIPEDRLQEATAMIPLGRFAEPEEMAAGVAFLASEEAGYITGVVLPIDGGIAM